MAGHKAMFSTWLMQKNLWIRIGGLFGKVNIYNPGDDPSTVKPQLVIKTEVDNHVASVLTEVGELHTPPKSKHFLFFSVWS